MVTGDNVLTAMSVARECGIIQPRKRTFLVELLHDGAGDGSKKLVLKPVFLFFTITITIYYFYFFLMNCLPKKYF